MYAEKEPLIGNSAAGGSDSLNSNSNSEPNPTAPISPDDYHHSDVGTVAQAHLIVDVEAYAEDASTIDVRSPLQQGCRSTRPTATQTMPPQHPFSPQSGIAVINADKNTRSTRAPQRSVCDYCHYPISALTCLLSCIGRQIVCMVITGLILYYLYMYHRKYYISKMTEYYGEAPPE